MRSFSFLLGWSLVAGATWAVAAEPNDTLRVAYNSTPQYTAYESLVLGAGVLRKENAETKLISVSNQTPGEPVTIPQQGSVDLGGGCDSDCDSGACGSSCGHCGFLGLLGDKLHGNCGCGWFGGLYYLNLFRADGTDYSLAYADSDPNDNRPTTTMARMRGGSGFGIRLGKMINPCTAVEAIYWQVFPEDQSSSVWNSTSGTTFSSTLPFSNLVYDPGTGNVPVSNYFTNAEYMTVRRTYDYRNLEVNFLRMPYVFCGGGCSRIALLAGPRYFRAEESLVFFSDNTDEIVGNDPARELSYAVETENHLVGFQVGGLFDYSLTNRLSGQFGSRVGIYNNHVSQRKVIAGGTGPATVGSGPDSGQNWQIQTSTDDVAFLGEFDAGLTYRLNNRWSLASGYKVIAVSGYADPVNQIPYTTNNLGRSSTIQNNDSLILHGVYVGAEFIW